MGWSTSPVLHIRHHWGWWPCRGVAAQVDDGAIHAHATVPTSTWTASNRYTRRQKDTTKLEGSQISLVPTAQKGARRAPWALEGAFGCSAALFSRAAPPALLWPLPASTAADSSPQTARGTRDSVVVRRDAGPSLFLRYCTCPCP